MRSIKPGRGPSMMGGIAGVCMAVFGVFWTIFALNIGAPWIFAGFGIVFIALAVVSALYNFQNATNKNRYSEYDITTDKEEPDPLNERFGRQNEAETSTGEKYAFCPYCGTKLDESDNYCRKCGKRMG